MTMQITANNIIDTLIPEFDEMEQFYSIFTRQGKRRYKPAENCTRWTWYGNDFEKALQAANKNKERAEAKISAVADALGVHNAIVWNAVLMARRWYNRTEWLKCLPENEAAGLWALAVRNSEV